MKKIMYITTLLCITNCNFNKKEIQQLPPSNNVNVMWQDVSNWDSTTASKITLYKPDKFIINIDGPGSDSVNPNCGPHIKNLISFIDTLVNVLDYKGIIVMHPDCSKGDYGSDWMGKGNLPNIDSLGTDVYKVYVDYFKEMNDSLKKVKLPTFTEMLIESEGSYIATEKSVDQKPLFDKVRSYMNDSTIKLSATNDWEFKNFDDWGVDYYYLQMYDMGWVDADVPTQLSGPNKYSPARIKELVSDMEIVLTHWKFPVTSKVCVTFTYAPAPTSKPHIDAPMFGEDSLYWTKSQFEEFITEFKKKVTTGDVGIWHCESPIKNW